MSNDLKNGGKSEEKYDFPKSGHQLHDATPNPRMLESLRDMGYDNYQAICDIIDNSVDSLLDNDNPFIKVLTKFNREGKGRISIVDNGCGMTKETLLEALKIGSNVSKDRENELGFFGFGLKSAAISIGRGFKIITKNEEDDYFTAIFDLDVAIKEKSWKFLSIEDSSKEEVEHFKKMLGKSKTGTIVEIYNLDKLSNRNKSQFDEVLLKNIAKIYRFFISDDINGKNSDGKIRYYLNEKRVQKIDPMGRELKDTKLLNDQQKDQKYVFNVDGEEVEVIVKYYYVGESISTNYPSEKITGRFNGFYVIRNNRQIMEAEKLGFNGIDKSSGHHANFRAELIFDGKYDHIFKTPIQKNGVILPQALIDKMQPDVSNYVKFSKDERHKNNPIENNASEEVKKDLKSIEDRKNKSLTTPTLTRDKHGNVINKEDVDLNEKEEDTIKRNRKKEEEPRKKKTRHKIKIDLINDGETGRFFIPRHLGGGKYLIRINVDHDFYKEFEKLNRQGRQLLIDLFHSYALAAHSEIYTEDLDTIDELIITWSNFLRRDIKNS